MKLTVLSVAYPLAPVGPDAVGGAEQVLTQLDTALVEAGHRSVVIACDGSRTRGVLWPVPSVTGLLDDDSRRKAQVRNRIAIEAAMRCWDIDVVHLHGIDFCEYLPPAGVPVVVTLHLPPSWYHFGALTPPRPNTFLNCVSATQRAACPPGCSLLPDINNGVALYTRPHAKRQYAISLGRICPEKGFEIAIDAASKAEIPFLLGGEVFPYASHQRYFETEIIPRLGRFARFLGPVGLQRKRRLLAGARCLVVPSLVTETSSLVAMEALACGTPVVAFPSGALAEIIDHGRTGFLVRNADEMAEAIRQAETLSREACWEAARDRFSLEKMTSQYLDLYRELSRKEKQHAA